MWSSFDITTSTHHSAGGIKQKHPNRDSLCLGLLAGFGGQCGHRADPRQRRSKTNVVHVHGDGVIEDEPEDSGSNNNSSRSSNFSKNGSSGNISSASNTPGGISAPWIQWDTYVPLTLLETSWTEPVEQHLQRRAN
ncbi:GM25344 [Drosophila sechellia]|uniref:GM25344 n=1 Tax=Drosophila sechellia TaxID=7238 RepID=B4HFM7_DROSE|nr:GM25344 [Drosophila sechellia]